MLKRPHYIALCVVIAAALLILNLPAPASQRLKLTVGSIFLPLFGLAGTSAQLGGEASGALQTKGALLARNRELEREISRLRLESMQATEAARENARLRQLVGWQQQAPWKLKLARVVLRDPANWWRTIHIDLGSRHGVRTNMPVLSTEGLVGRVQEVSLERCQVALVGDPGCRVSALVNSETRDTGVIGASGPVDERIVTMSYLSRNADLKPGQKVETSGLGGVFPKGIPIGQVVDSQLVEYGLYTQARVRLAASIGSLEEVWVLFP
jgi:rod shape-determining protein MreC